MGDPKKLKKNYAKPLKKWSADRLAEEKPIVSEYGLKNKKELWRMSSQLRKYAGQAKRLISLSGEQAGKERQQMIVKLNSLGLVEKEASLDNVLGLSVKDLLGRRLQTIVFKKNLARSMGQARQFIVHRHIAVGSRVITSPSFLVPVAQEAEVTFRDTSTLSKAEHPERAVKAKEVPDDKTADN
jgi:small subunit ribosomal protein S4